MKENLWLFGYGSIVWKTEFPTDKSMYGYIKGWHRRFWQGSPDHRGYPGSEGRVVTIIRSSQMEHFKNLDPHLEDDHKNDAIIWGKIYSVPQEHAQTVLAKLDHREKAGYERAEVNVHCSGGKIRKALVFVATADNPDFLGPGSIEEMAKQISTRVGPSGPNWEYLLKLAECMRDIGVKDPHLEALEAAVIEYRAKINVN